MNHIFQQKAPPWRTNLKPILKHMIGLAKIPQVCSRKIFTEYICLLPGQFSDDLFTIFSQIYSARVIDSSPFFSIFCNRLIWVFISSSLIRMIC